MPKASVAAIVLAAGLGKRFRSSTPKVLHQAAGRPLIHHVLKVLEPLELDRVIVVVGHEKASVQLAATATRAGTEFVEQPEQLGTGDAVKVCESALSDFEGCVLVVSGDMPLIRGETLQRLLDEWQKSGSEAVLLTAHLSDPTGYGRILEGDAGLRIVEEADASIDEKAVDVVSTGFWAFQKDPLFAALARVRPDNAQGEYYLTDAAWEIQRRGGKISTVMAGDEVEVLGANDRAQLTEVSAELRRRKLSELMTSGVTIEDPSTTYVDDGVEVGPDTVLRPMTFLTGASLVGSGCVVGPCTELKDSIVKDGAVVTFSVVHGAEVGERATVGPYAYLRPGTKLSASAKVGTFVEVKGSTVGESSKIPHLSYIGDAEIGDDANIGAGTITGNYDGETGIKSKTIIEDGVLTGSGTTLVAPVHLKKDAVTGAGAVVTKDVEESEVVIGVPARPTRKRKRKKRENDS